MPDLFGPLPVPAAPVRPAKSSSPGVRPKPNYTCTRLILDSGLFDKEGERIVAEVYIHPCGICGAPDAPYGSGVSLLKAAATRNAKHAGTWLCAACREAHT